MIDAVAVLEALADNPTIPARVRVAAARRADQLAGIERPAALDRIQKKEKKTK
jgi:hypothetical protein